MRERSTHRGASKLAVSCGLIAIFVASCGSAATPTVGPTGILRSMLSVAGVDRTYRLYVPDTLDQKQPAALVIVLGGGNQTGDDMAAFTDLDRQAATGRFIAVYPDSLGGFWNAGACCGDAGRTGVDDVGFVRLLIDKVATDYKIDNTRLFATGFSAGALMAYRLACDLAGRIAAIASAAGVMVTEPCQPNRPVSILEMHGTADVLIPYAGGTNPDPGDDLKTLLSSVAVIQSWVRLDGCTGQATQTADGITKSATWSACRAGTVVMFDTIVGGHHAWFGNNNHGDSRFESVPGEPDANAVLWGFFSGLAPRT